MTGSFLTAKEASRRLNVSTSTLFRLRKSMKGPPYIKLGRSVRYLEDALSDWARVAADAPIEVKQNCNVRNGRDPLYNLF